jgi:Tetratricopeptide repeat
MTYDFSISPKDFDVSLLPPNARTVGSDEFGEAVHAYLTKEFEGFGGTARIIVSDEAIQVTWNPDPSKPDPLRPAIEKLDRGQFPQAIQLLELLRSRSPNDSDILYRLGMALLKTGRAAAPLLAGLDKLLPWIHQWHPEIDKEFGETAGQSFQTMLEHDAHELGVTLEDVRQWAPPEKQRKTRTSRQKKAVAAEEEEE